MLHQSLCSPMGMPPALAPLWLLVALVPVSALFSALCLALAAFARSNKDKGRAGISCFIVEPGTPGFSWKNIRTIRTAAIPNDVVFEDCVLPADALIGEARAATEATGAGLTPWGAVALAALRGRERDAVAMLDIDAFDATQRGEGIGLTVIAWARAILYNGLGIHDQALAAAREAVDCPTNSAAAAWAAW
jgi:hypothetical protein